MSCFSLKCPVTAHWRCLASTQRDEILKAAREIDRDVWRSTQPQSELVDEEGKPKTNKNEPGKRPGLDAEQTTEFICGSCMKGGICMGCMETALTPDSGKKIEKSASIAASNDSAGDAEREDETKASGSALAPVADDPSGHKSPYELLFRCFTCKRLAHYSHLPVPANLHATATLPEIAAEYQNDWLCGDCGSYQYGLDRILAWRPYPKDAVEPPRPRGEIPDYKSPLPREYLVKWVDRSYRRVQWVPHMYLVATAHAKLKNFLSGGTKVQLLEEPVQDENGTSSHGEATSSTAPFEIGAEESRESSAKPDPTVTVLPSDAMPDAERRIPPAWKTVDRVLDILLWSPPRRPKNGRNKTSKKASTKQSRTVLSEEDTDDEFQEQRIAAFETGEEPPSKLTDTVQDWEEKMNRPFGIEDIDQVIWAFIKWDDLGYDESQ